MLVCGWLDLNISFTFHFKAQAHDSEDQQSEYLKMFQSFDSLSLSDLQAITEQPIGKPSLNNTDQPDSVPLKHAEEDDNTVEPVLQTDESPEVSTLETYEALPSPVSVKASISFPGKKVQKFIWTSGHFRILADILEFIWKIIEKWKRLVYWKYYTHYYYPVSK